MYLHKSTSRLPFIKQDKVHYVTRYFSPNDKQVSIHAIKNGINLDVWGLLARMPHPPHEIIPRTIHWAVRRLTTRYREIVKPRNVILKMSDTFDFCQAHQKQCCRDTRQMPNRYDYRQTSNVTRTLEVNTLVNHSAVVGASPVGATPATSSF